MKSKILSLLKTGGIGISIIGTAFLIVYFVFLKKEDTEEEYLLLGKVEQGDLTVAISESGQVSDAEEIELNPDASAKVTKVYVDEGTYVQEGQKLLDLDSSDAAFNLEEAEANLAQAQQDLDSLGKAADEIDIKKAENALNEVENSIAELGFSYDDNYAALLKTNEDHQKTIETHQKTIETHEKEIENHQKTNETHQKEIEDLLKQIEDYQQDITDIQENDLPSAFNSAYSEITNIFIKLPEAHGAVKGIVQGMISNQYGLSYYADDLGDNGIEQKTKVENKFSLAQSYYNTALDLYQNASREDIDSLKELVDETYETVSALSDTLKELDVFLSMYYERFPDDPYIIEHRAIVAEKIALINPTLSSIYNQVQAIDDVNDSIDGVYDSIDDVNDSIDGVYDSIDDVNDSIEDTNELIADSEESFLNLKRDYEQDLKSLNLTLEEKQLELEDLKNPEVDALDYIAKQLVVRLRKNSVEKAKEAYNDYFLYAPVAGYISAWNVSVGESLTSATIVGTLIDDHKQIVIPLNELDILDVSLGQTANIKFDAIPDFEANGVVVKKNVSGTVNTGVVSYEVTLSIQSEDERILTGMSADVDIVLLSKPDITLVSKVAVKEDKNGKYVEVVKNADSLEMEPFYPPEMIQTEDVYIEVADEDDLNYEVVSGLKAGDRIVLSTINLAAEQEDSASFGFPGSGGGGGGGGGNFTPPTGGGGGFSGTPPSF